MLSGPSKALERSLEGSGRSPIGNKVGPTECPLWVASRRAAFPPRDGPTAIGCAWRRSARWVSIRVVIGHSAFMADQANSGPYFQRRDLLWSHSAPRKKTQTWRKIAGLIVRAGTQLNPGLRAISAIRSNAAITSTHGQNQRFCRSRHDIRIDIYNPAKSIAAMMAGPSAMNPNSAKPSETAIPNAAATNTSMVVRSRKRRLEGRLDACTWTCLQAVAMAASGRSLPNYRPASMRFR